MKSRDNAATFDFGDLNSFPIPNCSKTIQSRMVEYIPGEVLSLAFPVKEEYTNPAGSMQGGFITAAFDNTFGPLCLMAAKTAMTTTLNLNTSYHRPIFPGDELCVRAEVITNGRTTIYMTAEARNLEGKLVATANTTYIHVKR
ncbi:MAG: PaaI family thioesterase [Chitinophagales bacterium]